MDILPLAGMLFSLLVVLIIAGSILMFPVMRQLGRLLGQRLDERQTESLTDGDREALLEAVESLQKEVARLADRQAFTERLLERGPGQDPDVPAAGSRSGGAGGSRDPAGGEEVP